MSLSVVLAIAARDVNKLLRDRIRLAVSLAFPILIIVGLGSVLASEAVRPADTAPLLFTGVLAATLFQSAAGGMLSLIQDRESDFTRVLFIAPITRLEIVTGKVLGESLVALVQGLGVTVFALVYGIRVTPAQAGLVVPAAIACCLLGAAFGLVTLALLPNQQAALQVLPFLVLPQYFLAGVIAPVRALPPYLAALSWAMPMRYVVDLTRALFFAPRYEGAVMEPPVVDVLVTVALFAAFIVAGAVLFDRRERSR